MYQDVKTAIQILRNGGIGIFPTDTAFGIGCRIDREDAIEKLFEIRKRPQTKATPVLVDSIEMVKSYLLPIESDIERLMKRYWPGGLTIVLKCLKDKIPELVRGGGATIGVRMPNHPITLELIKGLGIPLLGPSANFSGGETPYNMNDIDKNLIKLVDFIIEGKCSLKKPSTVIDCSEKPWKILREGAVELTIDS